MCYIIQILTAKNTVCPGSDTLQSHTVDLTVIDII